MRSVVDDLKYFSGESFINDIELLGKMYRSQLSSTDLVESKMANIERKYMLVGYCKLLSFPLSNI